MDSIQAPYEWASGKEFCLHRQSLNAECYVSGMSFLLSEGGDFCVFAPLLRQHQILGGASKAQALVPDMYAARSESLKVPEQVRRLDLRCYFSGKMSFSALRRNIKELWNEFCS